MSYKPLNPRWNLRVYPWHSINLIPILSASPTYHPEGISGQAFWLTIFGMVIMFTCPATWMVYSYYSGVHGPLWNRRSKLWYKEPAPTRRQ